MWKDIERRAKIYGIPVPIVPAPYPLVEFDRANLVGIVMNDQGLYLDYFKYTYEEWFLNGNEAGSEKNLEVVLEKLRVDLKETIKKSGLMESRYIENTQKALKFGIFGVPSFSFSNEIFWGDDRLEDAVHLLP
jgi:2-hydroxychromene-2-carboxylate isomerase